MWYIWMQISHEHFQSSKQSQIKQGLQCKVDPMKHTMDTHWKECPSIFIFFVTLMFPPWKTEAPFAPKHNNFFATFYLVSPPHFINVAIITSIKILLPNPSTTHSTWSRIGILTLDWTTYAWTQIHEPLSIVVTSSHKITMNLVIWMALIMASWTWICMIEQEPSH